MCSCFTPHQIIDVRTTRVYMQAPGEGWCSKPVFKREAIFPSSCSCWKNPPPRASLARKWFHAPDPAAIPPYEWQLPGSTSVKPSLWSIPSALLLALLDQLSPIFSALGKWVLSHHSQHVRYSKPAPHTLREFTLQYLLSSHNSSAGRADHDAVKVYQTITLSFWTWKSSLSCKVTLQQRENWLTDTQTGTTPLLQFGFKNTPTSIGISALHEQNTIKWVNLGSQLDTGSFQIMKLCKHFDKYGLNFQFVTKPKTRYSSSVPPQHSGAGFVNSCGFSTTTQGHQLEF